MKKAIKVDAGGSIVTILTDHITTIKSAGAGHSSITVVGIIQPIQVKGSPESILGLMGITE